MKDEQGEGRGPKPEKNEKPEAATKEAGGIDNIEQIEYLLHQSTLGIHFLFDNEDIKGILQKPVDRATFFTEDNKKKVQGLLSSLLDCASLEAKRSYLDRLPKNDFELLVHSYFQLVENTILAHVSTRH